MPSAFFNSPLWPTVKSYETGRVSFFFAPVLVHIFMIHRRMLCKIWSRIGSDNGVFWWSLSIIFISLPMTNRPPTPPPPPPRHQQYNTAYLYLCLMLANWSYNQSLNRYIVLSKWIILPKNQNTVRNHMIVGRCWFAWWSCICICTFISFVCMRVCVCEKYDTR